MSPLTATRKGASTRETIIGRAYEIASSAGLEGLSIGPLAEAVGMSKSGVFAHFGSREDLQLAVLEEAGERFVAAVLRPALAAPRGLPRLRAIATAWFDWVRRNEGGCLILSAASEYDDRPGPLRDRVIALETRWRTELGRAVRMAIDSGELAAHADPEQVAFEINALALAVHHDGGLFGFEAAQARGQRALDRLLRAYAPTA
ncbi:MAG TPA: TetR/AcrR family transcriptional regulator [Lysobacter sp.]|nr:TetR/AcrR family transcriptional regulator [Lysobacter sp.]